MLTVEKISAVTLKSPACLPRCGSIEIFWAWSSFTGAKTRISRRSALSTERDPILNLELGNPVTRWERLIFHVSDVDRFWAYLRERGLCPELPQDASWGERYFHMSDPDGHELSFARPI